MATAVDSEADSLASTIRAHAIGCGIDIDGVLRPVPFGHNGKLVLWLKPMGIVERMQFYRYLQRAGEERDKAELPAVEFVLSVCDEAGRLMFEMADIPQVLNEICPDDLAAIAVLATNLNRF